VFDAETVTFTWTPKPGQAGQYELTFTGQELETAEEYKLNVSTQLMVIKREGPILRNLSVEGSSGSVVISVELEVPNEGQAEVTFSVDDMVLDQQVEKQTGGLSFIWNTLGYGSEAETGYEVTAMATDGVIENRVTIGPILIDNQSPTIEAASEVVEAGTGDALEFNASVRDNGEVQSVSFVFAGHEQPASGSGDLYRTRFVVPKNPKATLRSAGLSVGGNEGSIDYPYYINASDSAGNQVRYPQEGDLLIRLLDRTPPQARIDKSWVMVNQGEMVALDGGQSTDNSGQVTEYAWDIDDSDGVNFAVSTDRNKKLVFKLEKSTSVSLQVRDGSGNVSVATVEVEVIDKTPPEAPQLTSVEVKGANVVISGMAEPKSEVDISLSGSNQVSVQVKTDPTGTFKHTVPGVPDGNYRLAAMAIDEAGNLSRPSDLVELVVDTRPPEISISLGEAAEGNQTGNVRPPVPVQISDAGGLAFIDLVLLEGANEVSLEGGKRRSGEGKGTATMSVLPVRDLLDGVSYTVKAVAYDLAGLRSENSFIFKINRALADKTPPEISFLSPTSEGMLTGDARLELVVEIRDLESGFDLSAAPISVELSSVDGKVALVDLMVDSSDI
ncbi:MAG: PKD domain-containing protein, partial [Pirellulaceae bacterium]